MEDQATEYKHEIVDNNPTKGWKFQMKFPVAQHFVLKIRNANKETFEHLEQNTFIPKTLNDMRVVVIKGNSVEEIIETKQRLLTFFAAFAEEPKKTHFIIISIATEEIKRNLASFKEEVIRDYGIPEMAFSKPENLYYIVKFLSLQDDASKAKAEECLKSCKEEIIRSAIDGKQLTLELSGISFKKRFNLHVRFNLKELKPTLKNVARRFNDEGFITFKSSGWRGKVYVLRSVYRDEEISNQEGTYRPYKRIEFDAKSVCEKYKNYNFGTLIVSENLQIRPVPASLYI